jgi:antiviral helicase SKI2
MTTEILLQMLYNSSEVINDLEWVIFDECHYVNDPERGHVWEEVFILLPPKVNLVLLSATVPNVVTFADWLGRTRKKTTYVVRTYKRPVPLEHFLYVGKDGKSQNQRLLIVDSDGNFIEKGYKEAELIMNERKAKTGFIKKTDQTERNIYINLIRHLESQDKLPVICFTLSRNRCEKNLDLLMSINKDRFQLTTKLEEAKIHKFIWKNLTQLKKVDRELPQILTIVEMLKRGLGVHHSGILPILKEITEILFCDGLVKVLFATETFAMGVNMPARTVVFDSVEKHDGNKFRDLKASEYIQMAGRAGRRGKDKTGTVIILCKYDIPDSPRLLKIMQGSASELVSQFRLTYHMILNLHKTAGSQQKDIENFLMQSFGEHNKVKQSKDISKKIESLQLKTEEFPSLECDICSPDIEQFCHLLNDYQEIAKFVMPFICAKALEKKFLSAGRIVAIVGKHNPFEAAVVLKVNKAKTGEISDLITLSLTEENNGFVIQTTELKSIHRILSKQIKNIDSISTIRENENRKNTSKEATMNVVEKFKELSLENNYRIFELQFLDPKENLKLKEISVVSKLRQFEDQCNRILSFDCIKCDNFVKHFQISKEKLKNFKELESSQFELSSDSLQLLPEYNSRIKVLQEKEYLNKHLVLELKGRIACLMSEHELVITEMLMNNVLGDLTKEEIAGLLSCFVFQQKTNCEPKLTEILEKVSKLQLNEFESILNIFMFVSIEKTRTTRYRS